MDQVEYRNKLIARYSEFSGNINVLTLGDKLNKIPGEKSFWALALSKCELDLKKLETRRSKMLQDLQKKVIDASPVNLTKVALDRIAGDSSLDPINLEIEELKTTVKFLERIYDCVKYISKDYENILKFMQMQEG